jgi:adenine-specific DNA-methyltransferase
MSACALDPSSPSTVDPRDFPLTEDDGRRYRRLPLRNTNKKFNPVTAPTLHFAIYGSPDSGRVATGPFDGSLEIKPVFGDGAPAVWRWSAARIDERPDDLVCRWVGGTTGRRADVFQKDWLHEGRRKKLRTIWLASEIGSTDTAVAELKALVGHLFESPKPTGLLQRILETMPSDARVLDPFAGSGTTGHAVALQNAADGGRRTCVSVNAPEPVRPGSNADLSGYAAVSDVTRVGAPGDEGEGGGARRPEVGTRSKQADRGDPTAGTSRAGLRGASAVGSLQRLCTPGRTPTPTRSSEPSADLPGVSRQAVYDSLRTHRSPGPAIQPPVP